MALPVVWSRLHALHDPADREALIESALHRAAGDTSEFALGNSETWVENPRRVDALLARLRGHGSIGVTEARRHSLEEGVLLVHDGAFVAWMRQFWAAWKAAGEPGRFGDGETGLLPDTFRYNCCCCAKPASPPPTGNCRGGGVSVALLNQCGWWIFDRNAPIVEHTFVAAIAAVDTALTAADLLLQAVAAEDAGGVPATYACCRPPGHHAGRQTAGGLCYFNNAAIATEWMIRQEAFALRGVHSKNREAGSRIAIIDIDFHHGNGTQEIFYERSDVFFCSIHADPDEEYPYFSGRATERGVGEGEGYNLNLPLPLDNGAQKSGHGVSELAYLSTVDQAVQAIREFDAHILVVSAGLDTYVRDPVGGFCLEQTSYSRIGEKLAQLQLPTLLVQEGGYDLVGLGGCIEALLQPFVDRHARSSAMEAAQSTQVSLLRKRQQQQGNKAQGEQSERRGSSRLRHHKRRKRGSRVVRVVEIEELAARV